MYDKVLGLNHSQSFKFVKAVTSALMTPSISLIFRFGLPENDLHPQIQYHPTEEAIWLQHRVGPSENGIRREEGVGARCWDLPE